MDSSGLPLASSNSITSNRKPKAEVSTMVQSKRAKFFATYQLQGFSLPDSIMFFIAKNPTSPELYQKIIQTCKYFFFKNPILVIPEFYYSDDGKYRHSVIKRRSDLSKITSKIWITDRLDVHPKSHGKAVNQNILSPLMPKLYRCDAKCVCVEDEIVYFKDISLLISSAKRIDFYNVTVKDKNGTNVALEKIIEVAVKAKEINISSDITQSNITSETMKELIKIPHFSKLDKFCLVGIPETFDVETFYGYMKKNKTTKIWLHFEDSVSEVYKNRLKEIVDEIIATKNRGYKPPLIRFDGLDREKESKLADIPCV